MNYVSCETADYVTTITINRTEALNALNAEVLKALEKALDSVNASVTRCIILTGAGDKAFVAGADIGELTVMGKKDAVLYSQSRHQLYRKLEMMPMPVIAAVNGYALGGGCELCMACDIRIASDNAVFGQPEVGLGIIAGSGGTQWMPRLLGAGRAKELLFTGRKIQAEEALAIGLVNAVYPADRLMEEAKKMADLIKENGPIAVAATKKAINEGLNTTIDSGLEIEARLMADCFETDDLIEGTTAFLEKRKHSPYQGK